MTPTILRLAFFALMSTTPVQAGVADTPLPTLNGQKSVHVFTVPGVTHVGRLGTVFICASTEKTKPLTVGIEIFNFNGEQLNGVGGATLTLTPGYTYTFETSLDMESIEAFSEDKIIALSDDANHATARILATSKNIVCSALLASLDGAPPTSMVSLSVVSQLKQDGD